MGSVFATLAALAVIGLLFALDPGGAIAESGFPDYREMDWKQLTAWGFRTIGVGVALLLVLLVWLKYRSWREIKYPGLSGPVTRQPSKTAGGGCIGAGRPGGHRPNAAGGDSRDVPARHVANSSASEQRAATGTGCRSRVPRSLTGSS